MLILKSLWGHWKTGFPISLSQAWALRHKVCLRLLSRIVTLANGTLWHPKLLAVIKGCRILIFSSRIPDKCCPPGSSLLPVRRFKTETIILSSCVWFWLCYQWHLTLLRWCPSTLQKPFLHWGHQYLFMENWISNKSGFLILGRTTATTKKSHSLKQRKRQLIILIRKIAFHIKCDNRKRSKTRFSLKIMVAGRQVSSQQTFVWPQLEYFPLANIAICSVGSVNEYICLPLCAAE